MPNKKKITKKLPAKSVIDTILDFNRLPYLPLNNEELHINDPRTIRATTGKKINPNKDLKSGKYNKNNIIQTIKAAKDIGVDPYTLLSVAMVETGIGNADENIGHVLGMENYTGNAFTDMALTYQQKLAKAQKLGIKDEAKSIQVYNGLGTVTPNTEKDYDGGGNRYGVKIPKEGINMKKNPLYGKEVINIRDSVLKQNPEIVNLVNTYELGGEINNNMNKKKSNKVPKISTMRNKDISIAGMNYTTQYVLDPYVKPMDEGGEATTYIRDYYGNLIPHQAGTLDANGNELNTDPNLPGIPWGQSNSTNGSPTYGVANTQQIQPNTQYGPGNPDPATANINVGNAPINPGFATQDSDLGLQGFMNFDSTQFNNWSNNNINSQENSSGDTSEDTSNQDKVQEIFNKIPKFKASTKPIIDTMSAFANIYASNQNRKEEMRMMRKNLIPVNSPNNFIGNDMPLYQRNGGAVVTNHGYGQVPNLTPAQAQAMNTFIPYLAPVPTSQQELGINVVQPNWASSANTVPPSYYTPNSDGSFKVNVQQHLKDRTANSGRIGADYTHVTNRAFAYEGTYGNKDYISYFKKGGQVMNHQDTLSNPQVQKGYTAKDFVTDPSLANVLVEGGEFLQFPDGSTSNITGDSHSDSSGGEYMNLPEQSRVYSDKLRADKEFSSDILGSKVKKKLTISDLAKKFNTKKEEEILNNTKSTELSKRTASINKELKTAKLDEIFNYQELIKNPEQILMQDIQQQIPVAREGTQIKPKRGGYLGQGVPPDYLEGYTAEQVQAFKDELYPLAQSEGYTGSPDDIRGMQEAYFRAQPELANDYFRNIVPKTNAGIEAGITQSSSDEEWMSKNNIEGKAGVRFPRKKTQIFPNVDNYMGFRNDSNNTQVGNDFYRLPNAQFNTPYIKPLVNIDPISNMYSNVSKPQGVPVSIPNSRFNIPTEDIVNTPIDNTVPNSTNPSNHNRPNIARKVRNVLGDVGDFAPEIFGAIQALNEFPIVTSKYQPNYLQATQVNIQDNLNRNFSAAQPLLNTSGNPSVANARAQQTAANLFDANNTAFQSKYNMDNQNRQQVNQYNNQLENNANMTNLQRVDDFWNKVTARQSNKEKDLNTVVNSAYAKAKNKMMENRSLDLVNQINPNFQYNPNQGMQFVDVQGPDGKIIRMPYNMLQSNNMQPGDGVETTQTRKRNPKTGEWEIVTKNKEKQGS